MSRPSSPHGLSAVLNLAAISYPARQAEAMFRNLAVGSGHIGHSQVCLLKLVLPLLHLFTILQYVIDTHVMKRELQKPIPASQD